MKLGRTHSKQRVELRVPTFDVLLKARALDVDKRGDRAVLGASVKHICCWVIPIHSVGTTYNINVAAVFLRDG